MKKLLITVLTFCVMSTQAGHIQNTPSLNGLLDQYLKIKNALVNNEEVLKLSADFVTQAKAIKPQSLTLEEQKLWTLHSSSIIKDAEQMAASHMIENQRKYFVSLSAHFYAIIKGSSITRTLYYQFCPMYNKGKGAYWISEIKNIQNPYYGKAMLTCGSTKETLH